MHRLVATLWIGQSEYLVGYYMKSVIQTFFYQQKEPIIVSLRMWFALLLNWFSQACLTGCAANGVNFGPDAIQRFCRLVVRTWPWTGADQQLQMVFMRSLAFASEDSVPVCKAMSTVRYASSSGATVLQLSAELAATETTRVKSPSADLELLTLTMGLVSNCCACVEGRQYLWKVIVSIVYENSIKYRPHTST